MTFTGFYHSNVHHPYKLSSTLLAYIDGISAPSRPPCQGLAMDAVASSHHQSHPPLPAGGALRTKVHEESATLWDEDLPLFLQCWRCRVLLLSIFRGKNLPLILNGWSPRPSIQKKGKEGLEISFTFATLHRPVGIYVKHLWLCEVSISAAYSNNVMETWIPNGRIVI